MIHRRLLKFYGFNADYLQRLKQGDRSVEAHFSDYFSQLIFLKLRGRLRERQLMEDICQETLLRVIRVVRNGPGPERPESFGAFVNSVCNNVTNELLRKEHRAEPFGPDAPEPADGRIDLDAHLITEERRQLVGKILEKLSERDRMLLRMLFLEERPPEEVCRALGVDPGYLRVLLHRAKARFRGRLADAAVAEM